MIQDFLGYHTVRFKHFSHFFKNNLYSRQSIFFNNTTQMITNNQCNHSSILLEKRTKRDLMCESEIHVQSNQLAFCNSTPSTENSVSFVDILVVTCTESFFLASCLIRLTQNVLLQKGRESAFLFLNINLANRKCNIRYVSYGCQQTSVRSYDINLHIFLCAETNSFVQDSRFVTTQS